MKKLLFITILIITLLSCNKDENTDTNQLDNNWFIQDYSCGLCDMITPDLTEEYLLWSFNTQNNTVSVVNYFSEDLFVPSGTYNFTYTKNEIVIVFSENSTVHYDYYFDDGNLVLSNNPELDGSLISFLPKETNCTNSPLEDLTWLNEIKTGLELSMSASGSQIIQYLYEDQCVYSVSSCFNCTDELVQVYNVSGAVICEFGGVEGLNTCPDFNEVVTNKRYLFNTVE